MWSRGHKARGRGQGHKTIRGQGQGPTLSRPTTGMLEAKDQGHNAQMFSKKVFINLPRGLWRVFQKEKKGYDLGSFFPSKK